MEFIVRAIDSGRVTSHTVDAIDIDDAKRLAASRFGRLLSLEPSERAGTLTSNGASRFALIDFSEELLVLLEAGLTVVEACEAIAEKAPDATTSNVLAQVLQRMRQGHGFSGSLESMSQYFPPLYISIVRSAERTSNLPEVLRRYVEHELSLKELKSKVVRASIYPAVLLVVGMVVTLFLLGYVVPRFASVYVETGRPLPAPTRILLGWGHLAGTHPLAVATSVFGAIVAVALLGAWAKRTGALARLFSRLPFIAPHVWSFQLARLYLTLGMLLEGGIPILQGLSLASGASGNALRPALLSARENLLRGGSISQTFGEFGLATPMALRMLRVGERSGRMGEMMSRISATYSREVSRAIDWFSRIFEPMLMVFIGLIIGTVVVLLYMPIFDLAESLR